MSFRALGVLLLWSLLAGGQGEPRSVSSAVQADGASAGPLTRMQAIVLQALTFRPPVQTAPHVRPPIVPLVWPPPRKISNATVDLGLPPNARFGSAVAGIGDLDDDGVPDLAVGAPGEGYGSVRILFLNRDRSVRSHARLVAPASIGWGGYGLSLCALGDLDSDGVEDIVVASPYDCQVFVHLLRADGTVKSSRDIALTVDPPYSPGAAETYGDALAAPGDLDGDGVTDLVMGCGVGIDGSDPRFYTIFLRPNGSVKGYRRTSSLYGCCSDGAALGDLDGDGRREVALEASELRIYSLNADGTSHAYSAIGTAFSPSGLSGAGDIDGDGIVDWILGEPGANAGRGRYWYSRLDWTGSAFVAGPLFKVEGPEGRTELLKPGDGFGTSLALLGNLDGANEPEIAVGAPYTNDDGSRCGAVWIGARTP